MDIDQRDIGKGTFAGILPRFYTNSISYLSELNEYRMYAEMWSNRKSKEGEKRKDIRHEGYLKTLEFGVKNKKRKSDKVRFDSFVVANSVKYMLKGSFLSPHVQIGGVQTNSIFDKIIKANKHLVKIQPGYPSSAFRSDDCLPETLDVDLESLDLQKDEESKRYYFEIPTDMKEIPYNQRIFLMQALGKNDFPEKLQLLHKVNRRNIRCLFANPKTVGEKEVSRLCVAKPFHETLVFDFAGTLEDNEDACFLGVLIKEKQIDGKMIEALNNDYEQPDSPQIDTFA